jgi:lipoprotein-anchoring transpeptidase ErfK/SrfK
MLTKSAAFALATTLTVAVAAAAAADTPGTRLRASTTVHVIGTGSVLWNHVNVRVRPELDAPAITSFSPFMSDYRQRAIMAVGQIRNASGAPLWYRVSIPGRPNGRTGWVPAASVRIAPVDRWLIVFRSERRFEFVLRGRVVRSGPVAIGTQGTPTPLGLFYVQAKYVPTGDPILGAYAFETSGYSRLSDWPGGGIVGVHGTNTPSLIGQAVSHGCIRLYNRDIQYLRTVVHLGTPVKVVR